MTPNDSDSHYSFPPSARIKKRPEILNLADTGEKEYSKHFLVILRISEAAESRLAVTITRKSDKSAVKRNRLRRRVREIFRLNKHRLATHFDILVIARKNATSIRYEQVRREILGILYHNRYLSDQNSNG